MTDRWAVVRAMVSVLVAAYAALMGFMSGFTVRGLTAIGAGSRAVVRVLRIAAPTAVRLVVFRAPFCLAMRHSVAGEK